MGVEGISGIAAKKFVQPKFLFMPLQQKDSSALKELIQQRSTLIKFLKELRAKIEKLDNAWLREEARDFGKELKELDQDDFEIVLADAEAAAKVNGAPSNKSFLKIAEELANTSTALVQLDGKIFAEMPLILLNLVAQELYGQDFNKLSPEKGSHALEKTIERLNNGAIQQSDSVNFQSTPSIVAATVPPTTASQKENQTKTVFVPPTQNVQNSTPGFSVLVQKLQDTLTTHPILSLEKNSIPASTSQADSSLTRPMLITEGEVEALRKEVERLNALLDRAILGGRSSGNFDHDYTSSDIATRLLKAERDLKKAEEELQNTSGGGSQFSASSHSFETGFNELSATNILAADNSGTAKQQASGSGIKDTYPAPVPTDPAIPPERQKPATYHPNKTTVAEVAAQSVIATQKPITGSIAQLETVHAAVAQSSEKGVKLQAASVSAPGYWDTGRAAQVATVGASILGIAALIAARAKGGLTTGVISPPMPAMWREPLRDTMTLSYKDNGQDVNVKVRASQAALTGDYVYRSGANKTLTDLAVYEEVDSQGNPIKDGRLFNINNFPTENGTTYDRLALTKPVGDIQPGRKIIVVNLVAYDPTKEEQKAGLMPGALI